MSEIEVVQAVYAALAERDLERLFDLLDPDCELTQDPALPWGGRHVGHEGFAMFAVALTGAIDSAVTIQAMFAADDEVIQFGRTKGTVLANGAAFDLPEVHRWRVRDGRIVGAHLAIDTAAMVAALSSG